MDHCFVKMLRYILHDSFAYFTNTTYTSLGLRSFHHAVAVRCSSCLFTAMRQNKLGEIVLLDSNAVPTSLTLKRSDGAQKISAFIPKRRGDDLCFQSAAPAIWNNLPNNITMISSIYTLIKKINEFYNSKI